MNMAFPPKFDVSVLKYQNITRYKRLRGVNIKRNTLVYLKLISTNFICNLSLQLSEVLLYIQEPTYRSVIMCLRVVSINSRLPYIRHVYVSEELLNEIGGDGRVVRRCLVNFQCRGVLQF